MITHNICMEKYGKIIPKLSSNEPCHEKGCKCHMRTIKAQIAFASAQIDQCLCCSLLR